MHDFQIGVIPVYNVCFQLTQVVQNVSQGKLKNRCKPPSKTTLHNGPFKGSLGEFISLPCEILRMASEMVSLMVVGGVFQFTL